MAITFITVPDDYGAIYNPIILTASSDNTAQPNFKFVIDIQFNSPSGITTKRIKMSPRPDGFLLFDAHRVVENYCSFDFAIGEATEAIVCDNSYVDFVLHIGEEYGTTPVVYPSLTNTSNLTYFNGALKHSVASFGDEPDRINFDYTDYLMDGASITDKFLTASPRIITTCLDKNYYLYGLIHYGNAKMRLRLYNSAGTITATTYKTFSSYEPMFRIGVGTKNISDWLASPLTGVAKYDITIFTNPGIGSPVQMSEVFTFIIDCDCSKYNEHFRLHWQNPLGGFDAYSFNQRFDRSFTLKKSSYKKILGTVDGAGAFTFDPSQAGKVAFDTLSTEQIKINSNNITEEECNWLFTLAKSTQVFWEIDADTYAPVVVKDSSYKQNIYANKKLFNAEFTIEIGNDIISQRQ